MNWLDVVLILVLVWSLVMAVRRGFSREVIGLISTLAAFFAGLWFYGAAGDFLRPYVSSRNVANLCGFFIVFLGVLLLGGLAGFILGRLLTWAGLTWFDRLLGAGFGLVRAIVISIGLVMALVAFSPGSEPPGAVVHSRLAPYVIDASHVLSSLAPKELKDEFRKRYEQVKDIWNRTVKKGARELPGSDI